MKKFLLIVVAISMLLLVGCNANKDTNISGNTQDQSQETFTINDYEGVWKALEDVNKNEEEGGRKLTIKVKDDNVIDFEYAIISAAPFNRIAQINLENVRLDEKHVGMFTWENDGWNNEGKGTIKLDSDKVIINITDVQVDENAMWGIFDSEVVFTEKINVSSVEGEMEIIEDTIQNLFIDKLKSLDNNNPEKLLDYRVDKVEIIYNNQEFMDLGYNSNDILAYVTYSVKPQDVTATAWIAGNGEVEGEWIINKVACECLRDGKLINNTGLNTGW